MSGNDRSLSIVAPKFAASDRLLPGETGHAGPIRSDGIFTSGFQPMLMIQSDAKKTGNADGGFPTFEYGGNDQI